MRRRTCFKLVALVLVGALAGEASLAQEPQQGGTLAVGIINALRQLDPHKTNQSEDYAPPFWLFNGLTRVERDRSVSPDLATDR